MILVLLCFIAAIVITVALEAGCVYLHRRLDAADAARNQATTEPTEGLTQ